MTLFELRAEVIELTSQADKLLSRAEENKTPLMASDLSRLNHIQNDIKAKEQQIKSIESKNTLAKKFTGIQLTDAGNPGPQSEFRPRQRQVFSSDYGTEFMKMVQTNGKEVGATLQTEGADGFGGFKLPNLSAALYEGSDSSGGYAVPITVSDQIVPLAPTEMAVRRLSLVIPTTMDIKVPQKAAFGTATTVAELGTFGGNPVSLSQFTLSAFMIGSQEQVSWELAQDVPAFQAFVVDDMILAQQMIEENLYVNGNGSGEPQGLIGNVGAGLTQEPDGNGNLVSIAGTLNLIGQVNAMYLNNAAWLMSRATSVGIRLAQIQANLFIPAWTRVGNTDYLHGYPVEYSGFMPAAARGATPVLFGDFKRGYVIGDRGGSGINVKVLDQPLATQGILVLLTYRRTDGRVRRSEAIQSYVVAAS
jgi:HK97 family phage major capsid protein